MLPVVAALAGFTLVWVALTTLMASRSGVVGSYLRLLSLWMAYTVFVPAGRGRRTTARRGGRAWRRSGLLLAAGAHAAFQPSMMACGGGAARARRA
jgi:hypothetical protein